jgi:hypothetical protein
MGNLIVSGGRSNSEQAELGGGEFNVDEERSASPFSNPAESMSAGGPC